MGSNSNQKSGNLRPSRGGTAIGGIKLLTQELLDQMDEGGPEFLKKYVVLEKHPDFKEHWYVNLFDEDFYFEVEDQIGRYKAIDASQADSFLKRCADLGKEVIWAENPSEWLERAASLNDEPEVEIQSHFKDTIRGFIPYQVQGFNYLKDLKGGIAEWSTGAGKTVVASALTRYHYDLNNFDVAFFVAKPHNVTNAHRDLKSLVGLDSVVVKGSKKQRKQIYSSVQLDRDILAINYEKFRVDCEEIKEIVDQANNVLIIWDEMPMKLKNRSSQVYKKTVECFYTTAPPRTDPNKERASLRQYMLSATPIENNPEDFFNCVRIIDPTIYGTVNDFRAEYVRRFNHFDRNKPEEWHNLDKMGLKVAHIVHQVDKTHPDIAKMFPKELPIPKFIDWNEDQRKIYDSILKEARKEDFGEVNTLALITILQMICDMPSMVLNSAAMYDAFEKAFEDADINDTLPDKEGSELGSRLVDAIGLDKIQAVSKSKLEVLKSLLLEDHPDEKITIFSAFNNGIMPELKAALEEWGITYVYYGGTANQRQAAKDDFVSDPDIRVFLSSDAGSDSINLQVGSVCIHYDLPWKWTTYTQRENRIHRVTSNFESVTYYTLMMVDSVEDRKLQVVLDKKDYHDAVFNGAIADRAISQRLTKEDFDFILGGD